jgi:hypothetical protein
MAIIIVAILFVLGVVTLKYNVEGEKNMPFKLSKITVISSQEGIDKENNEYRWAFDVSQTNDIYFYIEKNQNYDKQETIESVTIDNIQIQKDGEKGIGNIYKPNSQEDGKIFENTEENKVSEVTYTGDMESILSQLKINNQGGVIAFRFSNDQVAEILSNDEEINHHEFLKKAGIQESELNATLSFDMTIKIQSGKEYKANILLELPVNGVVEQGTSSFEKTDMIDVIFKRSKN